MTVNVKLYLLEEAALRIFTQLVREDFLEGVMLQL